MEVARSKSSRFCAPGLLALFFLGCFGGGYDRPGARAPASETDIDRRPGDLEISAEPSVLEIEGLVQYDKSLFRLRPVGEGELTLDGERIEWDNYRKSKHDFSIRGDVVEKAVLRCATRAGDKVCLELVLQTVTNLEYHFRDLNWSAGQNERILEVVEYLRRNHRGILFSEKAVDEID